MFCRLIALAVLGATTCAVAQVPQFLSWDEARNYVENIAPEQLPPELRTQDPFAAWSGWVRERDRRVRARLERGEEDTLHNFLMFGTSFTREPRLTAEYMAEIQKTRHAQGGAAISAAFERRVDDFLVALVHLENNERLLFFRNFLHRRGFDLRSAESRQALRRYLASNAARVVNEYDQFTRELQVAHTTGSPTEEAAARAVLFRKRGIALDTSVLPDYALQVALGEMKARRLFQPGSVKRVAIVGPGLDLIDKTDGYDFYPPQSTQPFAVIDMLFKLGLASPDLAIDTFDISDRVNRHLERALRQAKLNNGYKIELLRDLSLAWHKQVLDYWRTLGSHIGRPARTIPLPPEFKQLESRAFEVRPKHIKRITPRDLNVVYQHLRLKPKERFDVVIATNILVYYDVFEQQLALANLEHMLKPGGFLLTNNVMPELPVSRFRGVDYTSVPYSDKPADGDQIFWYQLQASGSQTRPKDQ